VTLSQLLAIDGAEFVLQRRSRWEAVRYGVGVGQRLDIDGFDRRDPDVPYARDVAPLPGSHVAELPEADRLGFFARADGVEELLFEEEHAAPAACLPVADFDRFEAETGLISTT